MAAVVYSATAREITTYRLGGRIVVEDAMVGRPIATVDLIHGFAHYNGRKGEAHEGMFAVVRGGMDGLRKALREGLRNGRDDRN